MDKLRVSPIRAEKTRESGMEMNWQRHIEAAHCPQFNAAAAGGPPIFPDSVQTRGGLRPHREQKRCHQYVTPYWLSTLGDVPADVANGRALLINDYAASPVQARAPSLVAV